MTWRDPIAGFFTFAVAAAFFLVAKDYPGGAAMFPRAVAGVMMACSAVLFVRGFIRPTRGERLSPVARRRVAMAVVLTILYIAAFANIGFITASLLFVPATTYLLGLRRHVMIWATTLGFVLGMHFLFTEVFHTPLPAERVLTLF